MNECNIVRDLMPLYADELLSQDSVEFIHRHVSWCESCREAVRLSGQELPEMSTNTYISEKKAIKKALRRERLGTVAKTTLGFLLILSIIACYVGFTLYQWGWLTPIERTIPSPDGALTLELVERDFIGCRSDGYMIRFRFHEGGWLNRYYTDWDTIDAHWADDSEHLFFNVTTVDGQQEFHILDTTRMATRGGTMDIPGLSGDLTPVLTELCRHSLDIPKGWETIEFDFKAWHHDSQAVTLRYMTDLSHSGLIYFHFPSQTITIVP